MVITKGIMTHIPVDTGVIDKDGNPVLKMVSLAPAYGCCLVFRSEEEAMKLGVPGPFETIFIGNEDMENVEN